MNTRRPISLCNIEQAIEEAESPLTYGQAIFEGYRLGFQLGKNDIDDTDFILGKITKAVDKNINTSGRALIC